MQGHKPYNQNQEKRAEEFLNMFLSGKVKMEVPVKTSREKCWNNIYGQLNKQKVKRLNFATSNNYKGFRLPAAAVILLLIGTIILYNLTRLAVYKTQLCEIAEFCLPDQSQVILNADSKIAYKRNLWNGSREVYLTGEAIFDVTKGKPFAVSTDNGEVNVLGTRFNVYTRGKNFKVACFTGKVKVELQQEKDTVILTPGRETHKLGNQILSHSQPFDTTKLGSWINGEFYYQNENIAKVFSEIERQFNVKIHAKNVLNRYYTGNFTNDNLLQALDLICIPMNLDYSFQDSLTIKITNKIEY